MGVVLRAGEIGACWNSSNNKINPVQIITQFRVFTVGYAVREGEVQEKNKTNTLQEQINFNEARRGSSQISELLP